MKRRSTSKKILESKFPAKMDSKGRKSMLCSNSEANGKYWKGKICDNWTYVAHDATEVLCIHCVNDLLDPLPVRTTAVKSDKPKGWKFMKEFVAKDGTVYHKGIEQPALKGTLPVTVIEAKPEKKKLTKQEKDIAVKELGKEIERLKGAIIREPRKGKKSELTRALSKANKQLKKLM